MKNTIQRTMRILRKISPQEAPKMKTTLMMRRAMKSERASSGPRKQNRLTKSPRRVSLYQNSHIMQVARIRSHPKILRKRTRTFSLKKRRLWPPVKRKSLLMKRLRSRTEITSTMIKEHSKGSLTKKKNSGKFKKRQ